MQAWGRLWSMDVHAANGRRVELLGELAALTVLAEQLGPAWQSQVHAHSALELARRLGMAPLVDQLDALLGSGEGDPVLTPREAQVTALVARGMSNAAIARHFTLSGRTIENHISRILSKLSLTSRTALALWHERR
jgi:DNA-binding NarL/FixJ family response regulator